MQLREVQLREETQREQFERACKFAGYEPNTRPEKLRHGSQKTKGNREGTRARVERDEKSTGTTRKRRERK